jgi:hypothetical protein
MKACYNERDHLDLEKLLSKFGFEKKKYDPISPRTDNQEIMECKHQN